LHVLFVFWSWCAVSCLANTAFYHYTHYFFFYYAYHLDLLSFPTRRSSDLTSSAATHSTSRFVRVQAASNTAMCSRGASAGAISTDRKSTRLNSSHVKISYAVFCLKKKKSNLSQQ